MKHPYMPNPMTAPATLVTATTGLTSIRMLTRGCSTFISMTTHTAAITAAATKRPTVRPEPQPQALPLLMASSRAQSEPARVRAPSGSTLAE